MDWTSLNIGIQKYKIFPVFIYLCFSVISIALYIPIKNNEWRERGYGTKRYSNPGWKGIWKEGYQAPDEKGKTINFIDTYINSTLSDGWHSSVAYSYSDAASSHYHI